MSIDLILWAPDKATFRTFAVTNGLLVEVGTDDNGNPVYRRREGFDFCWWRTSGKLVTARTSPPTYLPGFVALVRIFGNFFLSDQIAEGPEQWQRSKVARYIKNNGVPGTVAGGAISYYELNGVRIFRAQDVQDWLTANDLPRHEWQGGNTF